MKIINLGKGVVWMIYDDGTSFIVGPGILEVLNKTKTAAFALILIAKASPDLAALIVALALVAR